MPQVIEVQGVGTVQIPDGWGANEIRTIVMPKLVGAGVLKPQAVGLSGIPSQEALAPAPVLSPERLVPAPVMPTRLSADTFRTAVAAAGPLPGNEPVSLSEALQAVVEPAPPKTLIQQMAQEKMDRQRTAEYQQAFTDRGFPVPSRIEELPPIDVAAGRALGAASRGVEAAVSDVVGIPANVAGYTDILENVKAAFFGEPQPTMQRLEESGGYGIPGRVVLSAVGMAPRLAVSAGLGALGMPHVASSVLAFGAGDEGYTPESVLIAGALPLIDKLGRAGATKLMADRAWAARRVITESLENPGQFTAQVERAFPQLEKNAVAKAVEVGTGLLASNAFLAAVQAPEIWDSPDPLKAAVDLAVMNVGMSLAGVPEMFRAGRSGTLAELRARSVAGFRPPNLEVRRVKRPVPWTGNLLTESTPVVPEPAPVAPQAAPTPRRDIVEPPVRPAPPAPVQVAPPPQPISPAPPAQATTAPVPFNAPGVSPEGPAGLRTVQPGSVAAQGIVEPKGVTPVETQEKGQEGWVQVATPLAAAPAAASPTLVQPPTPGAPNAEAVSRNQEVLPQAGVQPKAVEGVGGQNVEQKPSIGPQPVEPGAQVQAATAALRAEIRANQGWQQTSRGRDVYKANLDTENLKDEAVVSAMMAAPSYPKLLAAYHRFQRSLHGKNYKPGVVEQHPWEMLDASAGVMSQKSQTFKTLSSLEDAVFKESGLPRRKQEGRFRGGTGIDWKRVAPVSPKPASLPRGEKAVSSEQAAPAPLTPEKESSVALEAAVKNAATIDPNNIGPLLQAFRHAHQSGYAGSEALSAAWGLYSASSENQAIEKYSDFKKGAVVALEAQMRKVHDALAREASAGLKALAVGEPVKVGPTTRSGPPPAKAGKGARETATVVSPKPAVSAPSEKAPSSEKAVSPVQEVQAPEAPAVAPAQAAPAVRPEVAPPSKERFSLAPAGGPVPESNPGGVFYRGDSGTIPDLIDLSRSEKAGPSLTRKREVAAEYGGNVTEVTVAPHKTLYLTRSYTKDQLRSMGIPDELLNRMLDNPQGRDVLAALAKQQMEEGINPTPALEREFLIQHGFKSQTLSDQIFVLDPAIVDQSSALQARRAKAQAALDQAKKREADAQGKLDRFRGPLIDRLGAAGIRFYADEHKNLGISIPEKHWRMYRLLKDGPESPRTEWSVLNILSDPKRRAEYKAKLVDENLKAVAKSKSDYDAAAETQLGKDILAGIKLEKEHGVGAASIYWGEYSQAVDDLLTARGGLEEAIKLQKRQDEAFAAAPKERLSIAHTSDAPAGATGMPVARVQLAATAFVPNAQVEVVDDPSLTWNGRLREDGVVELNAAKLPNDATVREVLTEELGHLLIRQATPEQLDMLARLRDSITPEQLAAVADQGYPPEDVPEEALAKAIRSEQATEEQKSLWQRFMDWLRDWWRKLTGKPATDSDLRALRKAALKAQPVAGKEMFSQVRGMKTKRSPEDFSVDTDPELVSRTPAETIQLRKNVYAVENTASVAPMRADWDALSQDARGLLPGVKARYDVLDLPPRSGLPSLPANQAVDTTVESLTQDAIEQNFIYAQTFDAMMDLETQRSMLRNRMEMAKKVLGEQMDKVGPVIQAKIVDVLAVRAASELIREGKARVAAVKEKGVDDATLRSLNRELIDLNFINHPSVKQVLVALANQIAQPDIATMTPAELKRQIASGKITVPNVSHDVLRIVLHELQVQDNILQSVLEISAAQDSRHEAMIQREGAELVASLGKPGSFSVKNFAARYHKLMTSRDNAKRAVASWVSSVDHRTKAISKMEDAVGFMDKLFLDPRVRDNFAVAASKIGAAEKIGEHDVDGNVTYVHPVTGKKLTFNLAGVDAHGIESLWEKYQEMIGWVTEIEINPNVSPTVIAGYRNLRDKIEHFLKNSSDHPNQGKLNLGGGFIPFTGVNFIKWILFNHRLSTSDMLAPFTMWQSGRLAHSALTAASEIMQRAAYISRMAKPIMAMANAKAAKSHGMTIQVWRLDVAQPILGASQTFNEAAPKIGQALWTGHKVTKEDMDAVRVMVKWIRDLTALPSKLGIPTIKYSPVNVTEGTIERKFVHLGPMTIPRRLKDEYIQMAKQWRDFADDTKLTGEQIKIELLNLLRNKDRLIVSHLQKYMDSEYRVGTQFRNQYLRVLDEIKDGYKLDGFDDLVNRVLTLVNVNETALSRGTVRDSILGEFSTIMRNIVPERESANKNTPILDRPDINIMSPDNNLNQARGDTVAPDEMYDYGAVTSRDQAWIERIILEMPFQRWVNGLALVKRDLEAKITDYKAKILLFQRQHVKEGSREEMLLGNTFVDLLEAEDLHKAVSMRLRRAMDYKKSSGDDTDSFSIVNAAMGGAVTGLLANPVSTGFRNMTGFVPRQAFMASEFNMGAKLFGQRIPVLSSAGDLMIYGTRVAVQAYDLMMGLVANKAFTKTARGRGAAKMLREHPAQFKAVFGGMWAGLANHLNRTEQRKTLGIYQSEDTADMVHFYLTTFTGGGQFHEQERTVAQKIGGAATSIGAMVGKTGVPTLSPSGVVTFADNVANAAAVPFLNDMLKNLQERAIRFVALRDLNGVDTAITPLTPAEILGKKNAPHSKAVRLRALFNQAGVNLDQTMLEYVKNYRAAQERGEETKDVPLVTTEQYEGLVDIFANESNRQTFASRNETLKTGTIMRIMGMLMNYGLFETSRYIQMMSKGSRDMRRFTKSILSQPNVVKASMAALGTLLMAALIMVFMSLIDVHYIRTMALLLHNEEKQLPDFHPGDSPLRQVGTALQLSSARLPVHIQLLSQFVDAARGNTKNGLQLLPLSMYSSFVNAGRVALQTGDAGQSLMELSRQWLPNTRVVLNRLGSQEGLIAYRSVNRLLRANAVPGMEVRLSTPGSATRFSKYSSNVSAIVNALSRPGGPDLEEARALRQELIERRMAEDGVTAKAAADSTDSSVFGRLPSNVVYGKKVTTDEWAKIRSRLKPSGVAKLDAIDSAFTAYGQMVAPNRTVSPTKAAPVVKTTRKTRFGRRSLTRNRRSLGRTTKSGKRRSFFGTSNRRSLAA